MDCRITFKPTGSRGLECPATRFSRTTVVFEVMDPGLTFRASSVLPEVQVRLGSQLAYQGRAVVTGLVDTGAVQVCEVALDEPGIAPVTHLGDASDSLGDAAREMLARWDTSSHLDPAFKLVVADFMTFLADLRLWCDGVELRWRAPSGDAAGQIPAARVRELAGPILEVINRLFERFEELAALVTPEARPRHRTLARRLLASYFQCAPFGQRSLRKPLGYAGDYEMMNMIHRRQPEGSTLFGRLLHLLLVEQWPARSVRHRVAHLRQHLVQETARRAALRQPARILSLGCGPAREVEDFVRESALADRAQFSLIDFDDETLEFAARAVRGAAREQGRHPRVEVERMSAQQLLRTSATGGERTVPEPYDLIYCGGLFDYLSEVTCRQLVGVFHLWLAPGGLAVVSNMDATRPFRAMLEFLLDWHLIYRNVEEVWRFRPPTVSDEACRLVSDPTGVNHFFEVRKPAAA